MLRFVLVTLLVLAPVFAPAQTMARPGWSGSGLKVEPWLTHAVLYAVDPHRVSPPANGQSSLAALTAQLDYIRSLGVDGITLTHLQVKGSGPATVDPQLGSLDDFDTVVREASRDNLRVLVQLSTTEHLEETVRFWLSRGVAGVMLTDAIPAPQLRALRDLAHAFSGDRVIIAHAVPGASKSGPMLDSTLASLQPGDVTALRHALEAIQSADDAGFVLIQTALDDPFEPTTGAQNSNAAVMAAVLLATRTNAQLVAGQEAGNSTGTLPSAPALAAEEADPGSLLNWYRSLIDLHHGSSAIRSGTDTFLDHDAQSALVWAIRRPQVNAQTPAVLVACNLSAKPLTLSLAADMAALHLRGVFLRTVLRSGTGMGGQSVDAVTLLPFGVFIGELRF